MSQKSGLRIQGLKALDNALNKLPENMRKRAFRSVLTSGGRVIASAAKKNIRTNRTGLLKKSIRTKSGVAGRAPYAVIGPSRSVQGTYKGKKTVPANYSHLVEYGTSHSKAQPFMRPALDSSGPAVMKKMARGLERFMAREAKKLKAKGGLR